MTSVTSRWSKASAVRRYLRAVTTHHRSAKFTNGSTPPSSGSSSPTSEDSRNVPEVTYGWILVSISVSNVKEYRRVMPTCKRDQWSRRHGGHHEVQLEGLGLPVSLDAEQEGSA